MKTPPQLSDSKRRLLDRVLRGEMARETWEAPVTARAEGTTVLLAPSQQQVWLHSQMAPELPVYNEPVTVHYRGKLNPEVMERSFREMIHRHEIWRTTFASVDGQVILAVHPQLEIAFPYVDLTDLPESEREAESVRLATADARRPFDISVGPLLRARLVKLSDEYYRLHLTLHHMIFDGVSIFRVLVPELAAIYQAFEKGEPSPLPAPPLQYGDYALWQAALQNTPAVGEQVAYWKQRLSGDLPVLQLPADRPRPPAPSYRGGMETFSLPADVTESVKRRCKEEKVTPYMFMLAAFKAMLHRYSGQEDILVGGVTDGRKRTEFQSIMGFFLQTVVLRTRPTARTSFRDFLADVKDAALGALANSDVPFDRLVRELALKRDPSRHPLFQVMFSIEPPAAAPDSTWDLTHMEIDGGSSKFDLYFGLDERREGFIGRFIYNTDLFDAPTIQRMVGHWKMILEAAIADASTLLGDLPMLTTDEQAWLRDASAGPVLELPAASVHALFEEQAKRTPSAIAIECGGESVTYRELDDAADRIAQRLLATGIEPGTLVGVCLERSSRMVAALLGALKAGAAYVPIDPALPPKRIALMMEDAQAPVVLTERHLAGVVAQTHAQLIYCDELLAAPAANASIALPSVNSADLAYVIYTSGSTGTPKGVEVSHGAVVNLLLSMQQEPGFTATDRLLAVTTISFDIAGLELFLPIITGGTVVIASQDEARDPLLLMRLLRQSYCTVMQATPATWRALIDSQWSGDWALKVLCGGEALPRDLAQQLISRTREVWNMYGPTETTIWSTIRKVTVRPGPVPIGRPIANTQVYVLDERLNPVAEGATGELYIGGAGVARGYRNRAELTAEKFVASPFKPGQLIYRTADLARWLPDGSLECLGRTDSQVKVRGFRIEIEEIETALAGHAEVRNAAVRAWANPQTGARLIAYVVAPNRPDLRQHLQETLPDYMIPSRFVFLDSLPLTPNGKVDRNALPAPLAETDAAVSDSFVAPCSHIELRLAEIFSSVLDVQRVGVLDNFFDLGGHSLLVAKLLRRIELEFGKRLTMSAIFQCPTIEHLAALLDGKRDAMERQRTVNIQSFGSSSASAAPLFWVYGGPFFASLAKRLSPGNAFVNVTLDPREERDISSSTLPQIAESLVRKIRAVQPHGPYRIAGWCVAGLIAYEVASQLVAAGDQVELVALVGSHNPVYYLSIATWRVYASKLRYSLLRLRKLKPRQAADYVVEKIRKLGSGARDPREPVNNFEQVLNGAAIQYVPQPFDARVVVIGESDRPDTPDLKTGWQHVLGNRVEVYKVSGDHISIFGEAQVDELAARLNACLRPAPIAIERKAKLQAAR